MVEESTLCPMRFCSRRWRRAQTWRGVADNECADLVWTQPPFPPYHYQFLRDRNHKGKSLSRVGNCLHPDVFMLRVQRYGGKNPSGWMTRGSVCGSDDDDGHPESIDVRRLVRAPGFAV